MNLLYGVLYGILAQIFTFLQLQGNIKWNWFEKYPIPILMSAIPLTWLYIKSVEHLVSAFNGEIWPSRLIGFGTGIIVFALMSHFIFNEMISLKTLICLMLAICIILVQLYM